MPAATPPPDRRKDRRPAPFRKAAGAGKGGHPNELMDMATTLPKENCQGDGRDEWATRRLRGRRLRAKGFGLNIQQAEWMRLYGCINGKVKMLADDSKQSSGVNLNSSEWKQCLKA